MNPQVKQSKENMCLDECKRLQAADVEQQLCALIENDFKLLDFGGCFCFVGTREQHFSLFLFNE